MSPSDFYRIAGPTEWATAPEVFSYSTLLAIETCPRRWQLEHSRYRGFDSFPVRPAPAAVEGQIVHELLERLFKTLALRGLPPLGSAEFRTCISEFDLTTTAHRHIEKHNQRVLRHPRGGAFRLRASVQDLVNRVIHLFRAQYELARENYGSGLPFVHVGSSGAGANDAGSAEGLIETLLSAGVLPERKLRHPVLPFTGVVDLIWRTHDGTHLVDFKTGGASESHRFQVLSYGVLWWRRTGDMPSRLEVRYPNEVVIVPPNETELEQAERELRRRIEAAAALLSERPAEARLGDRCGFCDVRAFCGVYWDALCQSKRSREIHPARDVEVTVRLPPGEYGFEATMRDGSPASIVCEPGLLRSLGPFSQGETLRILAANRSAAGNEIELERWTEVFHVS